MATVTVRISDEHHDLLKQAAAEEGQTLSDFIRDRLINAVVRPQDPNEPVGGRTADDVAPDSMSAVQRQTLALLHRILARVLPEGSSLEDGDSDYQLDRALALEEGFAGSYSDEFIGIRPELTRTQCDFVVDVLQMFRIITFSLHELKKEGQPTPQETALLEFGGFDHNDRLEGHMASYVDFLMRDPRVWSELRPQLKKADDGNSHSPMTAIYQRMLAEYGRIKHTRDRRHGLRSYLLDAEEIQAIADAAVHPSRRQ